MKKMQGIASTRLRRVQIREVLHRHAGSIQSLAAELGITRNAISMWLSGRTKSKRVAEAAERRALALLDEEQLALLDEEQKAATA